MALQYNCGNPKRRELLAAQDVVNGIDWIDVLDSALVTDLDDRRHTILVRGFLAWPPGLALANVSVTGGVRIPEVALAFGARLDGFAWLSQSDTPFGDEEWATLSALRTSLGADADRVFVLRAEAPGDHSLYTLALDPGESPLNLDPILREATFSFFADGVGTSVSVPEARRRAPTPPPPRIDYLAKDYASFRRVLLGRLSELLPTWTADAPADLLVTLSEVIASRADEISYRQDAVATEAYLATARRRSSARRHARLLDYRVREGHNARTWVAIGVTDTLTLPAGTAFVTALRDQSVRVASADLDDLLDEQDAEVFESLAACACAPARSAVALHTWGDEGCCLPKGSTTASLVNDDDLGLAVGDVILFEEVADPDTGVAADANPHHRHAVRLVEVNELTDPLTGTAVVNVRWHAEDRLPFPLRLGEEGTAVVVRANVVLADHGYTHAGEALVPAVVPAVGDYRPALDGIDLTFGSAYDDDDARTRPARDALVQDPDDIVPFLTLESGGDTWTSVPDLLSAEEDDPLFVVEMEEDRTANLRFGDGVLGAAPAAGATFTATYRTGNGRKGNVGAEALVHVVSADSGISWVRNPLPGHGGAPPEPLDDIRRFAPQAYRRPLRAFTPDDYATLLTRHPKVQRALARVRWTGSWREIELVIDRQGSDDVDADFLAEMTEYLEPFRLAGHELRLRAPHFVGVDVALTVRARKGFVPERVRAALDRRFSAVVNPDGSKGYFHSDHLSFGADVYLSPIIAAAMEVPGVEFVYTTRSPGRRLRFRRHGGADHGALAAGRIRIDHREIARVDTDPRRPEYGAITFAVEEGR